MLIQDDSYSTKKSAMKKSTISQLPMKTTKTPSFKLKPEVNPTPMSTVKGQVSPKIKIAKLTSNRSEKKEDTFSSTVTDSLPRDTSKDSVMRSKANVGKSQSNSTVDIK